MKLNKMLKLSLLLVITVLCYQESLIADEFVSLYTGRTNFSVMKDEKSYISFSIAGWGNNWSWQGWRGNLTSSEKEMCLESISKHLKVISVLKSTTDGFSFTSTMTTDKKERVTMVMVGAEFPGCNKGTWSAVNEKGEIITGRMPFGKGDLTKCGKVQKVEITDNYGKPCIFKFKPAITIHSDRDSMRMVIAEGDIEPGKKYSFTFDLILPGNSIVYTDPSKAPGTKNFDKWYAFNGTGHPDGKSYLDMSDWMNQKAGQSGRIKNVKDKLFYNNKPIKLWGINVCYGSCAPDKKLADKRAALYQRYGINAVRLHKYADGNGWQGILKKDDASEFDPDGLDRMDYFISKLKDAGIYVKLSPIFYVKPKSKNRSAIPYYDEFKSRGGTAQTGGGAMYLGKELQDLQIKQITNLLKHKNPYTEMTYAEDPVVSTVEITNEDSILFFGTLGVMQKVPALKKRAGEMFSKWLKKKYGTEDKLLAAWGKNMLGNFKAEGFPEESWENNEIYPIGNPWFYSPKQLEGSQKARKPRLLDTIAFLAEVQDDVYKRMTDAIRKTGYQGTLVASNWQAGAGTSHYLNLHSDAKIGIVDRHNYFGGGSPQLIKNTSMLVSPGSGTLSSSFQQVKNRPFMVSEWIHCMPNEWGVEGPAIIAAYGMGLQGWDVSYMFQNRDQWEFDKALQTSRNRVWNIAVPQILGSFPAVSRMVQRGDVKEAQNTYSLNVHLDSIKDGKWGFKDTTGQQHDTKIFTTDVAPSEALAISRIAVDFTEDEKPTPPFDFSKYKKNGGFVSDTGQLTWYPGKKPMDGYFTINTDATAAVCGFAENQTVKLKQVVITPQSRFASIFVTARNKDKNLSNDKEVLITAIARSRNQGANYLMDKIINNFGSKKGPIVMEPVKADITLERQNTATVHVLDHDGVKSGKTTPWNKGKLTIDTSIDKSPYYLIEYEAGY